MPGKAGKEVVPLDTLSRQHQEPSLVDDYHQSKMKLLEVVKNLEDPRDANNMDILRNASENIKLMAQTTQRIHSAHPMGRTFNHKSG
jgi:hypothetical protein